MLLSLYVLFYLKSADILNILIMVEKICHLLQMIKKFMNVVKSLLKLKFAVSPIRDDKYILAKLKIFKKKNITTFNNNNNNIIPLEKIITFVFLQ